MPRFAVLDSDSHRPNLIWKSAEVLRWESCAGAPGLRCLRMTAWFLSEFRGAAFLQHHKDQRQRTGVSVPHGLVHEVQRSFVGSPALGRRTPLPQDDGVVFE
jgi:hypothetical protein